MKIFIRASLLCFCVHSVLAGDAIVIGYNYEGVWTAVTYNRSSTPKGGPHYHDAVQACTFAQRDLRVRASDDLVRTEIVGKSDHTGYVAVAQGKAIARKKDVTAVGRGKSQVEADQKALTILNDREATTDEQIVYRYFSYGDDSTVPRRAKHGKSLATSRPARRGT